MAANKVVALFDDRMEAERVRDEIIATGMDPSSTQLVAQNSGNRAAGSGSAEPSMWEDIKDFFGFGHESDQAQFAEGVRRGGTLVSVSAPEEKQDGIIDILMRHHPVDIERRSADWRASGWQESAGAAPSGSASSKPARPAAPAATTRPVEASTQSTPRASLQSQQPAANDGSQSIPVVEEQIEIGKQQVRQGGVRIYSHVTEKPFEQQVSLRDERVTVERRPIDRPATDAAAAFQDKSYEVIETHEEPVIRKQARVVEEVVVHKEVQQRNETVRDTIRRRDVDVQQVQPGQALNQSASASLDDSADRRIYDAEFANGGSTYEQWRPAYAYGTQLAADRQYQGRDWNAIESNARSSYLQQNPGSTWDSVKATIRNSFERARNKV